MPHFSLTAVTCTGKPREWGKGSVKRDPGQTLDKDYYCRDFKRNALFDPRPTALQRNEPLSTEELTDLFKAIQTTDRDSVLLKHISISYEDGQTFEPDEVEEFQVSDFNLINLIEKVNFFYENYSETIRANSDPYLIPNTELQSKSRTWLILRCLMFTASIAKSVLSLQSPKSKMNFLRMRLWGLKSVCTSDMAYGIKNEDKALNAYIKNQNDPSIEVKKTGLWVKQSMPWYGCSPDALVYQNGVLIKIVEFKILKAVRKIRPSLYYNKLSKRQLTSFPLKRENNKSYLRPWHSHYYQVQMSMDVMGVQRCDYVLWSPKGVEVVPVTFDPQFWDPKRTELKKRHAGLTVTEYFMQRTPRKLYPIPVEYEE
ncbi:Putative pre-16S rRNA nuclease [Frankliniella fusca]|uniref:Pre-16S rRNA nuclease n=1 Tax=Frankliniella fusca TaxID=407009 RepID=A0AAE1LG77_9NEOP|nr:Putative pre-16S rRNA nuclease [Frankliniella fusca]